MLPFLKQKKQILSIDNTKPITDSLFVVIDTELTGLNEKRDSIISIGAVKMSGSRINLGNTFHHLIKPDAEFKPDSVVVHGITPSDVMEKPHIDSILSELLLFCDDDILVGHCVSIDLTFINKEMKRFAGSVIQNPVIDTYRIYEWLRKKYPSRPCFSSSPNAGLYEIAECFEINVSGAHEALMDAFITAQLFQRFMLFIAEAGIKNIGDLMKIGHPSEGGDKFRISSEISNF